MNAYFTIGFSKEERDELLKIFKDYPKWLARISNSYGTISYPSIFPKFNIDNYQCIVYENHEGKLVSGEHFYSTGIIPSWQEAKKFPNSLPTIGYFYNQEGKLCDSSRFSHYLNQESSSLDYSGHVPRFENTGEHLNNRFFSEALEKTYNT